MSTRLHLLFELGTLTVYFSEPPDYIKTGKKPIYWFDDKNTQGFGPFDTIYSAMRHYAMIVEQRKSQNLTVVSNIPNNIIHLDFKTKKRIT